MYCVYLDQGTCQNTVIPNTNQCLQSIKALPLNSTQDMNGLLPVTYLPYTTMDFSSNYLGYPAAINLKFKQDTSHHHHIFVGDLCPYLQPYQLLEAFRPFGRISECKIIQDAQTLKSKGYGFVTFVAKEDAQKAIDNMNGRVIGSRAIRTNWAVRRSQNNEGTSCSSLIFEEVMKSSHSNNNVIYCGGIQTGLTEELMYETFNTFGSILEVKLFPDKGYAFIRFSRKEEAAKAIVDRHLSCICGYVIKCSWGKKNEEGDERISSHSPEEKTPQNQQERIKDISSIPLNYSKFAPSADFGQPVNYQTFLHNSGQCYSTTPVFSMQPQTNFIMYPTL